MDKQTIGTIVLCVVLMVVSMFAFGYRRTEVVDVQNIEETTEVESKILYSSTTNYPEKKFTYETDLFNITFDTKGASISSMQLKKHKNADDQLVDIIFKGESDPNAFLLYWEDDIKKPILDNFDYRIDGEKIIFTNTYRYENGREFTITKTYQFKDGEYLFALDVDVDGYVMGDEYAYTIGFQPQVGPSFNNLGRRSTYDYRRFYVGLEKNNGKVKRTNVTLTGGLFHSTKYFNWISLTSKYFTVIANPSNKNVNYKYQANQAAGSGISQTNGLYVSVPLSSVKEDNKMYFYCGPQLKNSLGSYYSGTDNAWGLRGLNLDDAMESGSILGWLEVVLKWCLQILYKVVRNYGVAIIVLTIILKIVLWPLQKTSSESTAKMNAIAPEVNALKEKYPDNPQKQNLELSKLYKENGIKPLGGCLPLLIQFPILIAFYGLLNRHIELRGAMFIPGWIPDLSLPDTVAVLGFNIPLLGNEVHLLPIIYTASMIFSMKYTQTSSPSDASQKGTMFVMTWAMPIFFFFILYNAPSGLLLYWTTQNALSIVQQIYTNKRVASGALTLEKPKKEKVEPEAVRKYQEKLKKLEQEKKNK